MDVLKVICAPPPISLVLHLKFVFTVQQNKLANWPRTLCVVHVYSKQLFAGVHYLELIALHMLFTFCGYGVHYTVYMYCRVFVPVLKNA